MIQKTSKQLWDNFLFDYFQYNDKDSIHWNEYSRKVASNYFQSFADVPTYKLLDSIYSEEMVNQKEFKREYIKYYNIEDNDTINLFHYYLMCSDKLKKVNVTLDISFAFTDSSYGKKYFELLNSSQFSN